MVSDGMESALFGIGYLFACAGVMSFLALVANRRQTRRIERRMRTRRELGKAMTEQWATWRDN